jgi:hypothetical protein
MRRNIHDQETEIREISIVFAKEKSENRETKKSRHVQDKDCSEEARTCHSVFQAALTCGRFHIARRMTATFWSAALPRRLQDAKRGHVCVSQGETIPVNRGAVELLQA